MVLLILAPLGNPCFFYPTSFFVMSVSSPCLTDRILKKIKGSKDLLLLSFVLSRKTCSNLLSSETTLYQYGHLLLAFWYINNIEEVIPEKMQPGEIFKNGAWLNKLKRDIVNEKSLSKNEKKNISFLVNVSINLIGKRFWWIHMEKGLFTWVD